jgi:hypothetical protein
MSMNIFRLAGDMSHVFSIIILLLRLKVAKNANGACVRDHHRRVVVGCTKEDPVARARARVCVCAAANSHHHHHHPRFV